MAPIVKFDRFSTGYRPAIQFRESPPSGAVLCILSGKLRMGRPDAFGKREEFMWKTSFQPPSA